MPKRLRAYGWPTGSLVELTLNVQLVHKSLVELTLNVQFSEIEPEIKRSIFSLIDWPVTLNIYNKYIHGQFSHEKYISLQSFITESGY